MQLKNRVAIVTGGGRGIGRAIADKFVQNGAKVAICGRHWETLRLTAKEISANGLETLPIQVDVKNRGEIDLAVRRVVDTWGPIDILVNNAGISGMNRLKDSSDELWHAIIDTNLTGMYLFTKRVLPEMSKQPGSRIINLSSVLGKFGVSGYTAYCASKHGVIGFTRALAQEVAKLGITVNAICPGWVETDMAEAGVREISAVLKLKPEDFKKTALSQVPQRRFLDPEEVADLALYLASDAARGMTGQALNLCGGATTA